MRKALIVLAIVFPFFLLCSCSYEPEPEREPHYRLTITNASGDTAYWSLDNAHWSKIENDKIAQISVDLDGNYSVYAMRVYQRTPNIVDSGDKTPDDQTIYIVNSSEYLLAYETVNFTVSTEDNRVILYSDGTARYFAK